MALDIEKLKAKAQELAREDLDEKELAKFATYFLKYRDLGKLKMLAQRLQSDTEAFARSQRTKGYYNTINSLIKEPGFPSDTEEIAQYLCWLTRLIKYYKGVRR